MVFKLALRILKKFEICVLIAQDTNFMIWVTLKVAQNVRNALPKLLYGLLYQGVVFY